MSDLSRTKQLILDVADKITKWLPAPALSTDIEGDAASDPRRLRLKIRFRMPSGASPDDQLRAILIVAQVGEWDRIASCIEPVGLVKAVLASESVKVTFEPHQTRCLTQEDPTVPQREWYALP